MHRVGFTGAHTGIAVRVTAHPLVRALCDTFGGALVSTSANIASEPSPCSRAELDPRILAGVDAISEGETLGRQQPEAPFAIRAAAARCAETRRGLVFAGPGSSFWADIFLRQTTCCVAQSVV